MIRIIDHKKIDITDDEWNLYQEICHSYDRPNFKGSSLFSEIFETNENGIIIFLRPPTKFTSMEVFMFMMSVTMHQHIREMYKEANNIKIQLGTLQEQLSAQVAEKLKLLDELIESKQNKKDI